MLTVKKLSQWIDRYYIAVMATITPFILYYNWYAKGMAGLLQSYHSFKLLILNGFQQLPSMYFLPTFPMWGYGWLMLLSENKLFLLLFQNSFALCSLYYFITVMEHYNLLSKNAFRVIKCLMIVALPWYAFHSLRWPYSVAISLFLFSFALLYQALQSNKMRLYIFSAICFGLLLNFRSDYWLMPIGFFLIVTLFYHNKKVIGKMVLWIMLIYSFLIPWAFYAKKACDHYLITSTNAGHVCFIGLGNNPKNTWGIEEHDGDPVMHKLVNKHCNFNKQHPLYKQGAKEMPTLVYESDIFLKNTFFEYIKNNPQEYIKKCLLTLKRMFTEGTYQGEFFEGKNGKNKYLTTKTIPLFTQCLQKPYNFLYKNSMALSAIILQRSSYIFSKHITMLALLLLPFAGLIALFTHNLFFLLIAASVAYQVTLCVLCYFMPSYSTNMFFFYILLIVYALSFFFTYRHKQSALLPKE